MNAPPVPTSNYTGYRDAVREALEVPPEAWAFKADARYRIVLEHDSEVWAAGFYAVAAETCTNAKRWDALLALLPKMVAENDRYGAPLVKPCPPLVFVCSPTNFRYFCHATLILHHLERLRLPAVHLVEIGGGYGGLALYLHRMAPLFPTVLRSHTSIDLPEVAELQARYAAAVGTPLRAINGLDEQALAGVFLPDDPYPRYCISAFAFSEFDAETRAWYEHRVTRRCPHGFIIWNFHTPLEGFDKVLGGPLYPFVDAPLEVEPERPTTGLGNLVVKW